MKDSTYTNGREGAGYEYGYVVRHKGKRDQLVPWGTAPSYDEAEKLRGELAALLKRGTVGART